ncbi:hypothetical protein AGDE_09483 [Angomonas deanei]|uniref:Uncharacterized protein n=1 Tax=Angomonas deanei TaxID=59799 RepID=A0A7G2CKZ5_9TRYP|nr:hypothetical protein AGDE_09483 [Angomonas deanei]CAD2219243.1 hypothetical protein, conserved [Angomonas deanei]|eukprot:EPY30359.1 hypothetical protein AGDE_09483 [Angomonas deanei]
MTIQVRALQQKVSLQAANERDLLAKIANLEEMRQRFHGSTVEIERERHNWEAVTRQHEKDIEQLVANKNYNNQQLSILANENENLRAEIQGLLLRESQAVFSLKAKDNEMHELLKAYQNAAKEHESIADNHRYLEREIDNLRAALSVKEEGIIYLQEQVATLHQREQQLILDLQSFEYDNDQLHRKVLQNEGALKQCEAKCAELNQIINAKQCIVEELHQNLSELSKQIVIKENETFLLRRRSESIENELSNLHAALTIERDRNSSLEDCNARLLTKEYLSTSHENGEEAKIEAIKTQCTEFREQLNLKESELQALREERKEMEEELKEERKRSSDALETKRRLEQIVYDQNEVLSHLAK